VAGSGLRKTVPLVKGQTPKTYEEAKKQVEQNRKTRLQRAGVIAPANEKRDTNLTSDTFDNPEQQYGQVIWYYDRKKTREGK
jgi:hypothetical protein